MAPIRFAIVGPGMVARYHEAAIRAHSDAGAELGVVVHHNAERFNEISEAFGVPCVSEAEMLADPTIDAVILCTPSGQHADQAIAAARASKHVLVEKPIATTLADTDRMIAACAEADTKLGVVFQRRGLPTFQRVHQAITSGDLGSLTMGSLHMPYFRPQTYYDQAAWRGTWALDGGGVLMNQGIHLIDLLVWYMGDPVEMLASGGTLRRDIEVEDTIAATLRFANGSLATISATTTAAPGFTHKLAIYGTQGGIEIEGERIAAWRLDAHAQPTITLPSGLKDTDAGSGADPKGIKPEGHIAILSDFIQAIRNNRAPLVDGHEGRRSLATILSIYRAAGLRP